MYIKDMSHGGENVENKRRIWWYHFFTDTLAILVTLILHGYY